MEYTLSDQGVIKDCWDWWSCLKRYIPSMVLAFNLHASCHVSCLIEDNTGSFLYSSLLLWMYLYLTIYVHVYIYNGGVL